ncbi:MAG: DUF881 domain-containing protein [Candidatus Nanopelagicales bacterium]
MTDRKVQRDWLTLVLEADGIAEYREAATHHHRGDLLGRSLSVLSMMLVGFVVVSSAIGVARSRPQITAERDALRTRVIAEQKLTQSVETNYETARDLLRATQQAVRPDLNGALAAALDQQGMASGFVAVHGPGLLLVLDNSQRPTFSGTTDLGRIIDRDVQHAVNGLWAAGAEAISINDVRLTTRTSIRNAGNAILVDYKPVSVPLSIRAIGPSTSMLEKLRRSSEWSELTQLQDRYRIRWSVSSNGDLRMPAGTSALPTLAQPQGGS